MAMSDDIFIKLFTASPSRWNCNSIHWYSMF